MSGSILCELRDKYGDEVPLNTAALLELVELGRKLFNLDDAESFDVEVDFYLDDSMGDDV
jgi:hypothetical protein